MKKHTAEEIIDIIWKKIQNIKRRRLEPGCVIVDYETKYTLFEYRPDNGRISPVYQMYEGISKIYMDKIFGLPLSVIEVEENEEQIEYIEVFAKWKQHLKTYKN